MSDRSGNRPGASHDLGGELIHFELSDRLQAASEDIYLRAYWELKTVGFAEQPLASEVIDALERYPLVEMQADISRRYHIGETDAAAVMRDCERAVREQYDVK